MCKRGTTFGQSTESCRKVRVSLTHSLFHAIFPGTLVNWHSNTLPTSADWTEEQKDHTRKNQAITLPQGIDLVDVVIGEKEPRSDSKGLAKK